MYETVSSNDLNDLALMAAKEVIENRNVIIHIPRYRKKIAINVIIDNELWLSDRYYNYERDKSIWKLVYPKYDYYDKMDFYHHYSLKYYKLEHEGELTTHIKILKLIYDVMIKEENLKPSAKSKFLNICLLMNFKMKGLDLSKEEYQLVLVAEVQNSYNNCFDKTRRAKIDLYKTIERIIVNMFADSQYTIYDELQLLEKKENKNVNLVI